MKQLIMVKNKSGRARLTKCHLHGLLLLLLMMTGILASSTHAHDRNLTGVKIHSRGHEHTECQQGNSGLKAARHPQLILTSQRVEELKQQIEEDAFSERFFEHLVLWADSLLETVPLERNVTGRRLLRISQHLVEHVTVLGLVFQLTDEEKYAKAAIRQLRAVAGFSDWNPSHFLDTAEMTAGAALGYDWFYERLSDDDKKLLLDAVVEKGLMPSFEYDEWATRTNNWNSVGHGGMSLGALAVRERNPELAKKVLERAERNVSLAKSSYEPDGAYKEGPMYWKYGTNYLVMYSSALKSAMGEPYDFNAIPGFMESAEYMLQVVTPTGDYYNYGDNIPDQVFTPGLFWFEMQSGRTDFAAFSKDLVMSYESDETSGRPEYIQGGARFAPFALIWYVPSDTEKSGGKPLFWMGDGEMPVAVMRTAWDDPKAAFLGIKGGSTNVSHAHMDLGSFILELDGIRWVVDPGHQNYHQLEEAGLHIWNYHSDSDRWKVFRLGPEGHSILRVNDGLQNSFAFAPIEKQLHNDSLIGSVRVNLSEVYQPQLQEIVRSASLGVDRTFRIKDQWKTGGDDEVTITWQLITLAEVHKTNRGFRLKEGGHFLDIIFDSTIDEMTKIVDDVSDGLAPYDTENPGMKRIRVIFKSEAGSQGEFTATFKSGNNRGNF